MLDELSPRMSDPKGPYKLIVGAPKVVILFDSRVGAQGSTNVGDSPLAAALVGPTSLLS